ncbi:amino acid ABC transporter permease [Paenarthrobacter sp. CM16]|uniref:amino acid ABC transporter permease n=1 Tax=Paenarthrobacter sp. CM16 TaxID=2738447 RepID=UPI0015551F44|nr:amino acid ABC transporter permease [Paenarthrobacter sp. CM16]NQD87795.1 amino acid ABC transporter permease [Paenarthrobacter sp. CM16]
MTFFDQWITWLPQLSPGLTVSLSLTGLCLVFGMPFGLVLALMIEGKIVPLRIVALLFVEIGRGAPALVLLYLLYFGFPEGGIVLSAFTTAVISLSWTTGAYSSELFRAGLAAVPRGQREAATTSGLTGWPGFRYIILPQALRISTPPLASLAVTIFQTTSLAFVIAVPELMSKAYELGSYTFEYLGVFVLTSILYGAITVAALALVRLGERRLSRHL